MSVTSAAHPAQQHQQHQQHQKQPPPTRHELNSARLLPICFGEFLCERDLITDEQLLDALADHWAHGGRIGAAIARRGFLTTDEVEAQAALYHGLDVIEID